MSSKVQVTPRKRKNGATDAPTPVTRGKGKARGPPTPNPPLAPFPTPPSSRHRDRQARSFEDDFSIDASAELGPSSSTATKRVALPPSLETLYTLHHAFNLALSLYMATHPPVLPPHSATTTKLELTNITNFLAIKDTVERTGGRRFGVSELARLAWIWTWDGKDLPNDESISTSLNSSQHGSQDDGLDKRKKELDNPFLVVGGGETVPEQVAGLGYILTSTRTLDPLSGRRVHTYGIGIELDLKPGETRNTYLTTSAGAIEKGQGGGTGAVGRWNATGDLRDEVFRQRIERWVELHGGYEPPVETGYLPTPQTSNNSRTNILPIPVLKLPHLPSAQLLPAANLFAESSSSPGLTSIPKKVTGLADPFVVDESKGKGKVVRTGSVEDRRKAMMDRIKARSGKQPTLGSSIGQLDKIRPTKSTAQQTEELKRRSTLSRLEGVAEGVWMMFSASQTGSASMTTPPRGRRKAMPLIEVADVIVKSSKTPISSAEAETSLKMLADLCPFFLIVKVVAKQEWLEMPAATLQTCPTSPSLGSTSKFSPISYPSPSRRMAPPTSPSPKRGSRSILSSPLHPRNDHVDDDDDDGDRPSSPTPGSRGTMIPRPPASPTPDGRRTMIPKPPVSPSTSTARILASPLLGSQGTHLAGPASPGRVRRSGGLREVRERIRKELGE